MRNARNGRADAAAGSFAVPCRSACRIDMRAWLCLAFCALALAGCREPRVGAAGAASTGAGKPSIELFDSAGLRPRAIEAVDVGDSLSIGLQGLPPGEGVEIFLNDAQGREWSYARLFADRKGVVPSTLFWYQSGVIGTTSRKIDFKPEPAFVTFEEAEAHFARNPLRLSVKTLKGELLAERALPVRKRQRPFLYPSNKEGILLNAADLRKEDLYVTGTHFPAGSTVHLFAVDNQFQWQVGDPLVDRTGERGAAAPEKVVLGADQTRFTVKVWDHRDARPGAFDLVARIGELGRPQLRAEDILSFAEDTAVLYYIIINGNIVIDSAGRMKDAPAKFEFNDSFEKGQDVYAAVDPTDVPAVHSGGNYAAYWVVPHQPESYWDAPNPALTDISGGVEIHRVKYWCINVSRRLVWPGATQPEPIRDYDVIVDFGATPAMDAASFVHDNVYDKGTDFIDGYDKPGFTVFEDPGSVGPFAVGQVELLEPNGISGITDPAGVTGPTYGVQLAWAKIMYPATAAGTGTPVSGAQPSYPVALFLHGRHARCDSDGAGPGLASPPITDDCVQANRIPSHEGYNYIMERLASQGIVSISISAHDIQPFNDIWNYDARGRLVLKFLDKLRDWNANGSDPFGGLFNGKLDMSRIGLSGHSRGGEGVVAAEVLNQGWPSPHSIVAVNAIAPTDLNSMLSYVPTEAPYFLLVGARDGDVSSMHGFRTYDRASPISASPRNIKTAAWVHGANHNYFNTIWTDTAALGSPNPWAGSRDDASALANVLQVMSAADQRAVGLATIAAFFRRHLLGVEGYKEIFTGRMRPASMPNGFVFWTYQDADRKALDNFEQTPLNAASNSLGGAATAPGFATFEERLLNFNGSDYPGGFPIDNQFFHDTLGLRLGWGAAQLYTSELPPGQRDVSAFTHLSLRAAKRVAGAPAAGPDVNLLVNIEDGAGRKAMWDLSTSQFDRIPHPFSRSGGNCAMCTNQSLLVGVRIPLRNFTQNNSQVDLTDIVRVTIRTEGAGEIGIDDIEFGK